MPLSSWIVATSVATAGVVAVAGGSLHYYIFANQQSWDPGVGFKTLSPLFLSHILFLSWSYQVKRKSKISAMALAIVAE